MPSKPQTTCRHPGCQRLTTAGYCEKHKRVEQPKDMTRHAMYDYKWQQESKKFLTEYPWCVECLKENDYIIAIVVDHTVPHRGDHAIFWDKTKWQSLCKHHHDKKTARGE